MDVILLEILLLQRIFTRPIILLYFIMFSISRAYEVVQIINGCKSEERLGQSHKSGAPDSIGYTTKIKR